MDEMKVVKILLHIKNHRLNGHYGFSNINKNLQEWTMTDYEHINPSKEIKRNRKHFIWYKNNKPASMLVFSQSGKKGIVSITSPGVLYKFESSDYFYNGADNIFRPYIYVLDMNGQLYFTYRRDLDEVFRRNTESIFMSNEDLDSYLNESKNKEYFFHLIIEDLSKVKVDNEFYEEYKLLRKDLISRKISKESVYGIYDSYQYLKSCKKYSNNVLNIVDNILKRIDSLHYDVNYEKKSGSFYFTLDSLTNYENINLKVFENFSNKSEICVYNLQAREHFYINNRYIEDAINNAILCFTPINEQEISYDSIK